ncbi:MAG TPA: YneF family protein [Bacilli bacterium]|nr:YneF family protein [Bacilli bacterium]
MWTLQIWAWCLIILGFLLVGAVIGFFVSRKIMTKYLEKNPPVNEKMIRVMFQQMGRTPSEKQVRQVMASMTQAKNE